MWSCLIIAKEDLQLTGNFGKQEVHVVDTTLKKGTRVTGVDRSKLATVLGKRYDNGESIRSLAASTGRSYGFVHRILTETGVTLRGRGGATRRGKAKVKHLRPFGGAGPAPWRFMPLHPPGPCPDRRPEIFLGEFAPS